MQSSLAISNSFTVQSEKAAGLHVAIIDRMWPDFDTNDLDAALKDFRGRERRFGGVPEPCAALAIGGAR